MHRLAVAAPVLTALALLGPGSGFALAASTNPASDQYGGGVNVLGESAGGPLPFTGINVLVLLRIGLCMVAVGFAVRRAALKSSQ